MTERLTTDRLLRALSRFDAATVGELSHALSRPAPNQQRSVWTMLKKLVAAGLVSREGDRGHVARYSITDAGRAACAVASTNTTESHAPDVRRSA